jgi:hypothetical protein
VGKTVSNTLALAVADLDGDGDLDLITANESGSITAWRNPGQSWIGGWPAQRIETKELPVDVAAADLDADGDVDLAVAHVGGPTILQNDGTPFDGVWASRQFQAGTVGKVAIADLNDDGRLDLVTGGGLPWWSEPSESRWVTVWYAPARPFDQGWGSIRAELAYYTVLSLDTGDLDNDGDLDVVFGTTHAPPVGDVNHPVPREEWPDAYQIRALRNDGGSNWTAFDLGRDPKSSTLAFVDYHGFWGADVTDVDLEDLDRDGDLDILATEKIEGDYMVMGWQNDGTPFSGELWLPSAISKGEVYTWLEDSVLWAETWDVDLDGDLDVVSGSRAEREFWPLNCWENTGVAFGSTISETHWLRHILSTRREDIWAGQVADMDQDGDPDLITVGHSLSRGAPSYIRIWENAGFGLDVTPAAWAGPPGHRVHYVVSVSPWHGFEQPVDLWVSGLPLDMRVTWERNPLPPGAGSVLTLEPAANSLKREYSMLLVGIAGRYVRSIPFTLTVGGSGNYIYLPMALQEQ